MSPSAPPADSALALKAVTKRFGTEPSGPALSHVDLRAAPGAITGLLGPDGAGKTTLLRLAAGLLVPDAGTIQALGVDVVASPLEVQANIGYMPQRFGLYEDLSVQENLDLYADLQGVPRAERPARYDQLMHMTGLGAFTGRLAGRLSGGMKQKLGLACSLVRWPRLLLLDEPTVGVDPLSRRELWAIVRRLVTEQDMGVVLSTAYLDEAEHCHHVVLLHQGRVLGHGPPEIFGRPLTGRTCTVTVPGMDKRSLQQRLARTDGVVDALITGDQVRVILAQAMAEDNEPVFAAYPQARVQPVTPRFEDGFVTILREQTPAAARSAEGGLQEPAEHADRTETVIRVRDLQRRFGSFYAVRDLSFDVYGGEVFGLLGPNGAGKTTTFRMLCGLLPASGGELSVAGRDLRHAASAARARIGYMSQKFSLYGNLTVAENLRFFASAYGLRGNIRRRRIQWALNEFELQPLTGATSANLPLGYQQRLALACALMHEPRILFLDEPTSGVDPLARREFWDRINALSGAGVTVLVTTHFMEEAEYCDRLAILAAGELLALDAPETVKHRARSDAQPAPTMEDAFIALIEQHAPGRDVA